MIKRNILDSLFKLCSKSNKMAFISGPRQVGKTTLSKQLSADYTQSKYVSWDDPKNRKIWSQDPLVFTTDFSTNKNALLIFDEIHKSKLWKTQLKGVWDQREKNLDIIVTGSSQLNTFCKAGDSLLGRYYHFQLHPFTVGEITNSKVLSPDKVLEKILQNDYPESNKKNISIYENLKKYSGFPEPFIKKDKQQHFLWQKNRRERLVREDLRDLSKLPDLNAVETLMSLLPEKIGSGLSVENLRSDLETSHNTIKRWLNYLEAVYYHYSLRPYSKNISSSLRKEPKIYLFDYTEIENPGALYENIIANHLKKACDFWTDTGHGEFQLHYVKMKQGTEIDFLITLNKKPWLCIETKITKADITEPVKNLLRKLKCPLLVINEREIKSSIYKNDGLTIGRSSVDQFLLLLP
jgi:uncharacterized protein